MNLAYLVPRLVRHFLPESVTRFLLLRSLIIAPGLETAEPHAAVENYARLLASRGDSLRGKRVLVIGYGGRFDIGIGLLEAGAEFVLLCDKYARPDDRHNARLLALHPDALHLKDGRPRPRTDRMQLLEADLRQFEAPSANRRYDLAISNSVMEHVREMESTVRALARWSTVDCRQIHFVDLRDHFFKYPFEMLRYSNEVWSRWLDPTSHHNRRRIWDFRKVFESVFEETEITPLARDREAFRRIQPHIRPEFTSGDEAVDSVTLIRIWARNVRSEVRGE